MYCHKAKKCLGVPRKQIPVSYSDCYSDWSSYWRVVELYTSNNQNIYLFRMILHRDTGHKQPGPSGSDRFPK